MSTDKCLKNSLIALDWGTTNVRLALMGSDGSVIEERRGESGVGTFTRLEFESHFDRLTQGWPKLPAIAAGMIGSRQGWQEAPYLACPASADDLAKGLCKFVYDDRPITIVPGLTLRENLRFDVMRGEESQIAGFLTRNPGFSGTLLMPGTHSKWVSVQDATVISFQTYMTGEVFEALSQHTILRHSLERTGSNTEFFNTKVHQLASTSTSIEGELFGLRARHLLEGCNTDQLNQELSALLIMSELRAGQNDGYSLDDNLVLIGSEGLTSLYKMALECLHKNSSCMRGTGLVWPALYDIACKSHLLAGTRA